MMISPFYYLINMNEVKQFDDSTVKVLWYTMQSGILLFIPLIYILNNYVHIGPIMPNLKNILIGLCLISAAAPFSLLGYFKRTQRKIRDNIKLGMEVAPEELQRYFMFLLIGMSLCHLSGMFGLVLYIVASDLKYALIFIIISFFLGFLYKPELK